MTLPSLVKSLPLTQIPPGDLQKVSLTLRSPFFYGSSNIFDRVIQTKLRLISLFISTESSAPSDLFQQKQIQRLINGATISPGSGEDS